MPTKMSHTPSGMSGLPFGASTPHQTQVNPGWRQNCPICIDLYPYRGRNDGVECRRCGRVMHWQNAMEGLIRCIQNFPNRYNPYDSPDSANKPDKDHLNSYKEIDRLKKENATLIEIITTLTKVE